MTATILRKFIDWLVYSVVWIACCAAMMAVESSLILRQPLPGTAVLGFVFFSTLCHYNLHYLFRKRQPELSLRDRWSQAHRWWFVPAIIISAGLSLACLSQFSLHEMIAVVVLAMVSLWYSLPWLPPGWQLKQQGVLKPFILAAVWTMVTVWLPAHDADPMLLYLVMARRFVFILTLCLAFDVRDQQKDTVQNIRTIPVRWGSGLTYRLMDALLILFVIFAIGVEWKLHRYDVLLTLCFSALLTKLSLQATQKYTSEVYYLGVIDGMMIVQASLVWVMVNWFE